jgi:hypothetical protein
MKNPKGLKSTLGDNPLFNFIVEVDGIVKKA